MSLVDIATLGCFGVSIVVAAVAHQQRIRAGRKKEQDATRVSDFGARWAAESRRAHDLAGHGFFEPGIEPPTPKPSILTPAPPATPGIADWSPNRIARLPSTRCDSCPLFGCGECVEVVARRERGAAAARAEFERNTARPSYRMAVVAHDRAEPIKYIDLSDRLQEAAEEIARKRAEADEIMRMHERLTRPVPIAHRYEPCPRCQALQEWRPGEREECPRCDEPGT